MSSANGSNELGLSLERRQTIGWTGNHLRTLSAACLGFALLILCPHLPAVARQATPDPFGFIAEPVETDEKRAVRFFEEGKFDDAQKLAFKIDASLGDFNTNEKWFVLGIRCHLAKGNYKDALRAYNVAIERYENSIQLRWLGAEVLRYNDQPEQAIALLVEIEKAWLDNGWRYRSADDQIVLGHFHLWKGVDAKRVLTKFYNPAKLRSPNNPSVYNAIGNLALAKHDYGLAAENFNEALLHDEDNVEALVGLARSFAPSDAEKENEAINKVLARNPNQIDALLLIVDNQVASEDYDGAKLNLKNILKVNSNHPAALAYRAVLAHLDNDPTAEAKFRSAALKHWPGNPEVDHLIGRELSQKYRFTEGETYQRRALVYDKNYLPAKMQLAHDLLRLGQELEGWKLADEVFDADQYSVVAHNLVTLRDQLSKFKTLEQNGFVVRMSAEEAGYYGRRVLNLLVEAEKVIATKYDVQLEKPIFIEIFPRQQDFAIRTFGLPGGQGFLGVCFGRVITMNSPAAQGTSKTSWESVLWHEFCHVVTLQKTKNRMPRWLSEGISVYEETLRDQAWGESFGATYQKMVGGEDLTPVSQLSSAFLRPKTPLHLQFAYFEAGQVVDFLIEKHGLPKLQNVLDDLAIGTPINDALRRHVAPVNVIDRQFETFIRERANNFAPYANWEQPKLPADAEASQWAEWNEQHPNNATGLIGEANALIRAKDFAVAEQRIKSALKLMPFGFPEGQLMLSKLYQAKQQPEKELEALEAFARLNANQVDAYLRILELTEAAEDWDKTKFYSRRLLAVNPLLKNGHQSLSRAAEATEDSVAAAESLAVLANMNPLDIADVNFRLATALLANGDQQRAKRAVLTALEQAPRYRDAHRLLHKIRKAELSSSETSRPEPKQDSKAKQTNAETTDAPAAETTEAQDRKGQQ